MLALRKGDEQVWSTDVAVPISRLPDLIEVSKKELDELGLFASAIGHVGDGNFHESVMYDGSNPAERKKVEECVERMVERALEMEGTCTVSGDLDVSLCLTAGRNICWLTASCTG